jgi:ketosteroid isomerase-like protein
MTTTTSTGTSDVAAVQRGFQALADGDIAAFGAAFAEDATWNHRNADHLGGIHQAARGSSPSSASPCS